MRPAFAIFLVLATISLGCQGTPKQAPKDDAPNKTATPKANESALAPTPPAKSTETKAASKAAVKVPAQAKAETPNGTSTPSVNPDKAVPPTLPPSRFRLSTLRAKELQVHQAPKPPLQRTVRHAGPRNNDDLKTIAKTMDAPDPSGSGAPAIERIDENRVRIGRIVVDKAKKQVEVEGAVNMTEGILEYYSVGPMGKVHESVLIYHGLASQVHLGLLLLGLEPKRRGGPKVKLTVQWKDRKSGEMRQAPASSWLMNRATNTVSGPVNWRFRGSGFFNGRYAGDSAHTLVGLVPDPNVVIVLDADTGNPYQGADLGFEVMTKNIPGKGTPVRLIIQPAKG